MLPIVKRSWPALPLALFLPCLAACSPGEPTVVHVYDAYEGEAYPSHRTPLVIPKGGAGFVTNSYSDTVSVVGILDGQVLGTYPVGRDPVSIDGPHHVVVSPSGDAVYVGLSYPATGGSGPHAAHGSSVRAGYAQKLDGHDMHIVGQVRVDNNPGDIVLSEDGKRLVLSHFDLQRALKHPDDINAARATVAVIDPSKMDLVGGESATLIPACVAPHGTALSRPNGATAYLACYGEDAITVVDLDKGEVTARVPVGANADGFGNPTYGPYSLVLSPNQDLVAIGNTLSKDVRFFDTKTGKMRPELTITTLGAPYFPAWSPDQKTIAIPMQAPDAMVVVDLETKAELVHRDFKAGECPLPHVTIRMTDGGFSLVCEGDHKTPGKVLWLDPKTLDTVRDTAVGLYPDAFAMFVKEGP